jgi:acyl-coenzyme A thioesterase PaaI-like protein
MSRADGDAPSPGLAIRYPDEPFEMHVGPHYCRGEVEGIVAGFRAKPNHANRSGNVHGGTLSAFADSALTGFALHEMGSDDARVSRITLACEFVAPATVGD